MSSPPPSGCPECEAKIILNGGVTARLLDEICYVISERVEQGFKFPDALKLVKMANKLEDDAFKFQREVLEQLGFQGPWPKSMS
jgi:hypothetical protein